MAEAEPAPAADAHLGRPRPVAFYGCMGLGGEWGVEPSTAADIAMAEDAVRAALEAGFTAFDHADIYRDGKAESVFGEILSRSPGLRDQITIQTKCGIRLPRDGRVGLYDLRGDTIRAKVHASLERMRIDAIDILLLHRPDPLAGPQDIADALTALHREGLVRHFGVSNMSGEQIALLQSALGVPIIANQLEMSLHHRDWLEAGVLVNTAPSAAVGFPHGTIERCVADGIALQAWGPLAQGRYTGRPETAADEATAAHIADLARSKGTTPETILLWWLRRHPAGIAPVIGTTNPARIAACRDAVTAEPDLTHDEWYELWITARGEPLP